MTTRVEFEADSIYELHNLIAGFDHKLAPGGLKTTTPDVMVLFSGPEGDTFLTGPFASVGVQSGCMEVRTKEGNSFQLGIYDEGEWTVSDEEDKAPMRGFTKFVIGAPAHLGVG